MDNVKWGVVAGGVLMALGSFLPWAQAGIFSVAGTSGDGVITLIVGVLVTIVGIAKRQGAIPGLLVIGSGGLGLFIVYGIFQNLDSDAVGTGLFVTGLGSLIAAVAGFTILNKPQKAPVQPVVQTPAPPTPATPTPSPTPHYTPPLRRDHGPRHAADEEPDSGHQGTSP